jgi:Zn-dependent protease
VLVFDQGESPYDLRFHIGSTPVRVHPFFWLTCAFLGWRWIESGFGYLLLWIACCFVSVLLHELGHVWMGMAFGTRGDIVLQGFGGLAIGSNDLEARWQRIAVSLAGPGIQLALFGVLFLVSPTILEATRPDWFDAVDNGLYMLRSISLYWPLLNLLPIWPLDGGMVTREVCSGVSSRKGLEASLLISILSSGILAVHCLLSYNGRPLIPYIPRPRSLYMVLFFALFCVQSVQLYQMERSRHRPWDDDMPWDR